jgi:hypothetical protein
LNSSTKTCTCSSSRCHVTPTTPRALDASVYGGSEPKIRSLGITPSFHGSHHGRSRRTLRGRWDSSDPHAVPTVSRLPADQRRLHVRVLDERRDVAQTGICSVRVNWPDDVVVADAHERTGSPSKKLEILNARARPCTTPRSAPSPSSPSTPTTRPPCAHGVRPAPNGAAPRRGRARRDRPAARRSPLLRVGGTLRTAWRRLEESAGAWPGRASVAGTRGRCGSPTAAHPAQDPTRPCTHPARAAATRAGAPAWGGAGRGRRG